MGHLILSMATVTNIVTGQVMADADEGVTRKASGTTKCLQILENCDDECKPIVGGPPTVRVISEGHKI